MDGERTINGRAFAAFALAAVSLIFAIFVLSYTLKGSDPAEVAEAPLPAAEVPAGGAQ